LKDVVWVFFSFPRELGRDGICICAGMTLLVRVARTKSAPAFGAKDPIKVFPKEEPAKVHWQWNVAVRTGVNHEERINLAIYEAVKVSATPSEPLDDIAGGVVYTGCHCASDKKTS